MLVKAVRIGYYNDRRQKEGSVFKLVEKKKFTVVKEKDKKTGKMTEVKKWSSIKPEDQFSPQWMEKISKEEVAPEVLEFVESVAESASSDVI